MARNTTVFPFSYGLFWFKEALRVFSLAPLSYLGVVLFYLLTSGLLSSIPLLGQVIASAWMPFGTLLIAMATRNVLEHQPISYDPLFSTLKKPGLRTRLLNMGLVYALALQLVAAVFFTMASDTVASWADVESLSEAEIPWGALIVTVLLYLPCVLLSLFSPILAADAGLAVAKSFFFSISACLLQWRASLMAGLLYLGSSFVLGTLLVLGFRLLGIFNYVIWVAPFYIAFMTAFGFAFIWPMYRDLFGEKGLLDEQE